MPDQQPVTDLRKLTLLVLSAALPVLTLVSTMLVMDHSAHTAQAAGIGVGLITDVGGLGDMGFNWESYQGLLRAQTDFGVIGTVYTSTTSGQYTTNLQQCVTDGNALCISVGFLTSDAISNTAASNPGTKFAILDTAFASYPSNLRGITFDVNGAAYMGGMLAGSMSQSRIVGDIGGIEIPPVMAYTLPFRNGAQCAIPSATTLITYTNDFGNPNHGAQVAQTLISQGADVIFSPAGQTGTGAVLTATQTGKWGIGVDTDNYNNLFGGGLVPGANKLLTSVIKKLDNAVYFTARDVVSNTFTSGTTVYDLAADGVGLAPYHQADSAVSPSIKARVAQIGQDIIAGKIDVNSSVCENSLYLSLLMK